MAFSWQEETYPAGTQNITVDIEYLDKSYIFLYLNGVLSTAYTWASDSIIKLNTALAASTLVTIVRRTDREYLYIRFGDGAAFIKENLDTQNTQFLHLAQEMVEGRSISGFYGNLSMNGYRITNLGTPVDAQDAVNKTYVDTYNTKQDSRITSLENVFTAGLTTATYPWSTTVQVSTNTLYPAREFDKAMVYLDGVLQTPDYSFEVVNNTIVFAEQLPVGTMVYAILGENIIPEDGYASAAQFNVLANRVAVLETNTATEFLNLGNRVQALEQSVPQDIEAVNDRIDTTDNNVTAQNLRITTLENRITPINKGGTGSDTAEGAKSALGLNLFQQFNADTRVVDPSNNRYFFVGDKTANPDWGVFDLQSNSKVALPVTSGGTGSATAAGALTSLGAFPAAGVVNASNAGAGKVGELLEISIASVTLTNATAINLTSLVLTPGDWDVSGAVCVRTTDAPVKQAIAGLSTVNNTVPTFPKRVVISDNTGVSQVQEVALPVVRFNVSVNTAVYLNISAGFISGSATGEGYIRARRVR